MRKFIARICLGTMMAFAAAPVMAQNQTVTGSVVDENGEPVIGASVMVRAPRLVQSPTSTVLIKSMCRKDKR